MRLSLSTEIGHGIIVDINFKRGKNVRFGVGKMKNAITLLIYRIMIQKTFYFADYCGFCCTNNVLCKLGHYQGHQRSFFVCPRGAPKYEGRLQ